MNGVHAIVTAAFGIAEPVLEGRERLRGGIEPVHAMRGGTQPERTARVFCDRPILREALWPGAIPPELVRRRIEAVQTEIRGDPQRAAPVDPQRSDGVVAERPRVGRDVHVRPGASGAGIEADQAVAARPEPQIAAVILRNGAHTSPEHRLVVTGDLIRPPVDPVQPTLRADPQGVRIFLVRRHHGALRQAARIPSLVAV